MFFGGVKLDPRNQWVQLAALTLIIKEKIPVFR